MQGTVFVSFISFTSTLKLKTHSQLTQNLFTVIDCLFGCALESCIGRLSAIKVQLELEKGACIVYAVDGEKVAPSLHINYIFQITYTVILQSLLLNSYILLC